MRADAATLAAKTPPPTFDFVILELTLHHPRQRVAAANGSLIVPPKKFVLGDTASAFADCEHVFEGRADSNGQEHLYIETQGAYAVPTENGGLRVHSSTQGPTAVQRAVCRVTGVPMHQVEVDVRRLGGGFGGKEDQANAWASICVE